MKMLRGFALITSLLCLNLTFGAGTAHSETTTLRVAAFFPATSVAVSRVLIPWMAEVEKEAGGDLKLEGFWGGSLGAAPAKQYDLMRDGVADIVYFYPSYTPGRFPDYGLFELPYLVRSAEESSLAAWRMYDAGQLAGLEDTHVIGMWGQDPALLHSRVPIKSIDEIKGKKLRAGSSAQGEFLKHLGALPVGISTTEMAEAINRGLVDGGVFSWGGLRIFRLKDVVPHHFWAPMGSNIQVLGIRKSKWDSLSPKAKAALTKLGGEHLARFAGRAFDGFAENVIQDSEKDSKQSVVRPSDADLKKFIADAKPIFDAWIGEVKDGEKKLKELDQTLGKLRASN